MAAGKKRFYPAAGICCLLVLLLLVCLPVPTDPEEGGVDVDLVMAREAVGLYSLTDGNGKTLVPRKAPEMQGRGNPDVPGEEPDYRGVVGYAALQNGWEVSRFDTFTGTPWQLPLYEQDGEEWVPAGTVSHKTPVLVTDQQIREEKGHRFRGRLQVICLDTNRMAWIDVTQFITVPYWTLDLDNAAGYGFCIAVYQQKSGHEPIDRKGGAGSVADGTRVLMCDRTTARYFSPDKENNPLLGIEFRSGEKEDSFSRTFLFFSPEDLTLIY